MKKYFLFSFLFFIFISLSIFAQKDTVIGGVHYIVNKSKNPEYNKFHKRLIPLDSEYVEKNKKFRYFNNWFTVGAGVQQNISYARKVGFTGGADFCFHIKRNYFQTGVEIMGERFSYYQNYQFHLGYGLRIEDKDVQFAAFVGPSYSIGALKVGDTAYSQTFSVPGLFIQAELVKKIARDVGIGVSLYTDWNQQQTLVGLRGILFFSSSYRGKKYYNEGE